MKPITDYTDRELLELCAAYCVATKKCTRYSCVGAFRMIEHIEKHVFWLDGKEWNPIEDAGDRARMCDELMIDLNWHVAYVVAYSIPVRETHAERCANHPNRTTAANYAAVRLVAMMELAKRGGGV